MNGKMRILSVWSTAVLVAMVLRVEPAAGSQGERRRGDEMVGVQREAVEWSYTSSKAYADPFNDVEVDVIFTNERGRQWRVPAFWAGGNEWRVRFAAPEPGVYRYRSESTDKANPDLNSQEGTLRVEPYRGMNRLLIHGPLRVSENRRYFEHVDGTPFLWLGDTWWKMLARRISFEEFKVLAADRREKGFSVVQIVAGLYPDEPPFDPRGYNEGGFAWEPGFARINPQYFDYADRRLQWLVKSEMVPAIVGCWGYYLPWMGVEKMKKHWRYLLARYGAYPVVWILAGEGLMPYYLSPHRQRDRDVQRRGWIEIAKYLRTIDPYRHPVTIHPSGSGREELAEDNVLDFDMLQTGHGNWDSAPRHVGLVSRSYSKTPPMPVVVGETVYEGHQQTNWQDRQRFAFWSTMMNGAAGFTYGAGGIWQANGTSEPHGPSPWGITYENRPWNEAMRLPGSRQVGIGKTLLSRYQWWRFTPHPEWVEPHGTAFLEPHSKWFSVGRRWAQRKGDYRLPYASGIPGQVRVIYVPARRYDPLGPLVTNIENGVTYHASYVDPISGEKHKLGTLVRPRTSVLFEDSFDGGRKPEWTDLGEKTTVQTGEVLADKSTWMILNGVKESDVIVSVESGSNAETGLILRAQNAENCLVAVYSPVMKGVWIHERRQGDYGPRMGFTAVPEVGSKIQLVGEVHGTVASLTISDGKHIYRTAPVKVASTRAGSVGLWAERLECKEGRAGACRTATGDRAHLGQHFDNFRVQVIEQIPVEASENIVILNAWRAPLLPVSQDWVLLLERQPRQGR